MICAVSDSKQYIKFIRIETVSEFNYVSRQTRQISNGEHYLVELTEQEIVNLLNTNKHNIGMEVNNESA
jgi:hypothetical protein